MAYGNRPRASGKTGISFPQLECWSPITESATFAAEVDGRRVLCRIDAATLLQRNPEFAEPMVALARNRTTFQTAARRIIEREAFEQDGSVVIREADLVSL